MVFLRLAFSCFPGGQVAKLFQDSSLGNAVNIVVTRLILLMEDQVKGPKTLIIASPECPHKTPGASRLCQSCSSVALLLHGSPQTLIVESDLGGEEKYESL